MLLIADFTNQLFYLEGGTNAAILRVALSPVQYFHTAMFYSLFAGKLSSLPAQRSEGVPGERPD